MVLAKVTGVSRRTVFHKLGDRYRYIRLAIAGCSAMFLFWWQEELWASQYQAASVLSVARRGILRRPRKVDRSYSSHQCIGNGNRIEKFYKRVCHFENICYANGSFLYYREGKQPLSFDRKRGVQYEFQADDGTPFASYLAYDFRAGPFAPLIIKERIPDSVVRLQGTFALWKIWAYPVNFGHLVWEDIGNIYSTQKRLTGFWDRNTQTLQVSPLSKEADFERIVQGIMPAISTMSVMSLEGFIQQSAPPGSTVCFDHLFVGAPTSLQQMEGHEELLADYRTRILKHYNIAESLPASPVIYITDKSSSVWTHAQGSGRHRAIANARELRAYLAARLPHAKIATVEWHNFSIEKQLDLLAHTSILITPCGGVSMVIPFLPEGAHAIVMDYLSDGGDSGARYGYDKGDSASMEVSFLDRFPHVTKYYYQIYSQDDLEWDFEGATDLRNDASVKVHFERMYDLVNSALISMGYE